MYTCRYNNFQKPGIVEKSVDISMNFYTYNNFRNVVFDKDVKSMDNAITKSFVVDQIKIIKIKYIC